LKINMEQLELSVYLRYWHRVNYPEIWEYVTLFLNKYIEKWYSKYLSWIRLIPIRKNIFPRIWFFERNDIKTYNVEKEKFDTSLKKYAIPFHFSHSGYNNTENLSYITSAWMDKNGDPSQIDLWLELEKQHDKKNWTDKKTIDEILKQVIKVMQELDKKLK
jgi:hypothetical protein